MVYGYASVSLRSDGSTVVDSQNDVIAVETIERAATNFVLRHRGAGEMHDRMGVGRLVASWVITDEMVKAFPGTFKSDSPRGWMIGFKIDDADVWARVKNGELKAFSIGGRARSRPANF